LTQSLTSPCLRVVGPRPQGHELEEEANDHSYHKQHGEDEDGFESSSPRGAAAAARGAAGGQQAAGGVGDSTEERRRVLKLRAFYRKHDAEKVKSVESMLGLHSWEECRDNLNLKYGESPEAVSAADEGRERLLEKERENREQKLRLFYMKHDASKVVA
jgi:hypothetical protein